jgi:RND family efflux transporter MFP subunit
MRRLFGLAIVFVFAGCPERDRPPPAGPTPEPLAEAQGPVIDPAAANRGYLGVLTPRESAEVVAPFTTTVTEIIVNLGDVVEAGAKLAVLDPEPLKEQLAVATAEHSQAATSRSAAATALKREKAAYRAGVASKSAVTEAQARLGEAGAGVRGAKARVEAIKRKLADTTMVAPIAGKIALRYVEPGARIEEGQPVIRVISSSELFVRFAIPIDDTDKLAAGDAVEVMIEGRGSTTATVKTIAPELDPIAQMILAEAELIDGGANLQSGLVCRIVVGLGKNGKRTN